MRTRKLGNSGIEATVVGLGTWGIGGWLWGGTDEKAAVEAIRASLDAGITFVDTAPAYGFGLAERLVAQAVGARRDKVVIATKCGLVWDGDSYEQTLAEGGNPMGKNLSPDSIRWEVEQSLKRLKTDRIDLYQTHWPDAKTPIEDTMAVLLDLKEQGKIRAIGVSNASAEQLNTYCGVGAVDCDQERYSMIDRECEELLLPYCEEHEIAFLAYSPLSMGLLTGKLGPDREFQGDDVRQMDKRFSVETRNTVLDMIEEFGPIAEKYELTTTQLVIAWTAAQPGVTHVLVGARNPQQAAENAWAGDVELENSDLENLNSTIAKYLPKIPKMSW